MKRVLWFDMDGTIVDFYGVTGWLDMLNAEAVTPYEVAKPLVNMGMFSACINRLQNEGYEVGIISWASKYASDEYVNRIAEAKARWLMENCPAIQWDYFNVVPYGTPKHEVCGAGTLFDDEVRNLEAWENSRVGVSFNAEYMMYILNQLIR